MTLPTTTKVWILANPPEGEIQPDTFSLEERPIPELKKDEILVEIQYLSNDPAQRGWMQKDTDPKRLYVPPVVKGDIVRAGGLGKVLKSTSEKYKEGDLVSGSFGWQQYIVLSDKAVLPVQPLPNLSPSIALSVLGGTSLTAWFGLYEVGLTKPEHTVLISGAGGATGSAAIQIAKLIIGCKKVVGIAGGAKKCAWVKSLGADDCLDYKSPTFKEDLKNYPDEFDVYFDNVGGEILNATLPKIRRYGRIIACGSIAAYNDVSQNVFPNYFEVISNRITIQGMLVLDYIPKFGEVKEKLSKAIKEGKLATEGAETVVDTKFEDIPKTWQLLFSGGNQGKLITKYKI